MSMVSPLGPLGPRRMGKRALQPGSGPGEWGRADHAHLDLEKVIPQQETPETTDVK